MFDCHACAPHGSFDTSALSFDPGTPGGASDNRGKHASAYIIYIYINILLHFLFYSIFVLRLSTVLLLLILYRQISDDDGTTCDLYIVPRATT